MRFEGRRLLRLLSISAVVTIIIGYGLFEARYVIEGPQVKVFTPHNGDVATSSRITVEGVAKNTTDISLNGGSIFIDEQGHFSDSLLLSPGYTILTIVAHDRFGREVRKTLELTYH